MKKYLAVVVIITFISLCFFPHFDKAQAGSADGALIGGAIGLVIGTILYVASMAGEKTMDEQQNEKKKETSSFLIDKDDKTIPNAPPTLVDKHDQDLTSFTMPTQVAVTFSF